MISCKEYDTTGQETTCLNTCVDNNGDGNAYCNTPQVNSALVDALNAFCETPSADGFYCPTNAAANTLVYCVVGAEYPAQIYWACTDGGACAAAKSNADPCLCDSSASGCVSTIEESNFCTGKIDGLTYCNGNTMVSCIIDNNGALQIKSEEPCPEKNACEEPNPGDAGCIEVV